MINSQDKRHRLRLILLAAAITILGIAVYKQYAKPKVLFIVTGFTDFCGLSNPSKIVLDRLQNKLVYDRILVDVSIDSVQKKLPHICQTAAQLAQKNYHVIILHLGLVPNGSKIQLEQGAINELTFSCKDNAGNQPQHEKIEDNKPLDYYRATDLPLEKIKSKLTHNPELFELSQSGGTFVSNYIYYYCLQHCAQIKNVHCLYVHIPPLDKITLEKQLELLESLIKAINASI